MYQLRNWIVTATLLGASAVSSADSDLLAHVACQAEIAALGDARGLDLETGQTYVDPTEDSNHRYYINASSGDGDYRATCLVTPRGKVLEAELDSGRWAYVKRQLGTGGDASEGLAAESRR